MRRILASLAFVLGLAPLAASAKPVIVLVPGFFNSLAPGTSAGPYYSSTVVRTLSGSAQVFVIDNLSPVGRVAENGERLATYLNGIRKQYPGQPIILLTHSAGGFYSFYALTHHPDLPVKAIVTMALPYAGVEWISNLTFKFPQLESIAEFLSLGSLEEFESANAIKMSQSFRLPDGVRVIAIAGTQPPCLGLGCALAENLSWPLAMTQETMSQASDGIVTLDSALAKGLALRSNSGRWLQIERWSDINIGLEHWEMVIDSTFSVLVGVVDTGYIDRQQKSIYSQILKRLGL